jgi:DNA-binding response OmpR family regulator
MIVEDEKDLCFLLSLVLKQHHFTTLCANSIREARQHLGEIQPLILFLDNHLTDGSGIDFIIEVKKHLPYTKIVVITAHNSSQDHEAAMKNGADYFISKPFDVATIFSILKTCRLGNTG